MSVVATRDMPLCLGCSTLAGDDDLQQAWPCVNCGVMLRHRYHHHFSESFCSEACEDIVYARRELRRVRKQRKRDGIICVCCGVSFRPRRRGDATTCSPACRQRMYRERVTDRSMSQREP